MIVDTLDKLVDEITELMKQTYALAKMNKEFNDKLNKCEKKEDTEPTLKDLREMAKYIVDTNDDVQGITIEVITSDKHNDVDEDLIKDLYGKDEEEGGEE